MHISDLHYDPRPRLEERLPDIIAAERPDLIVFKGDSVNSPARVRFLARPEVTVIELAAPAAR